MKIPIKTPTIIHGADSIDQIKNFKEKRVLFITDKFSRSMLEERLVELLEDKELAFFDEVEPNPKYDTFTKAGNVAQKFKPDLIIGVGGGSVLDTAKGAYFLYGQPTLKLSEINYFAEYNLNDKTKLIQIPTTSGTGSESSAGIVYTDPETGTKKNVISSELIAGEIIIDPTLPASMPKELTISSGIDALAQAIESSLSILGNDFTLGLDLHSINNIMTYLPQAANEGSGDLDVREKIHYAASMVGVAMSNTSLGIGHACGHAVGSIFDIQHGYAVGVMIPYNILYNQRKGAPIYQRILSNLNIPDAADPAKSLSQVMIDFLKKLDAPCSFKELDIPKKEWDKNLKRLVATALSDPSLMTNPRSANEEKMTKLFEYAYEGYTVDF